jgi:ABC-type transporter Mla MlaB component
LDTEKLTLGGLTAFLDRRDPRALRISLAGRSASREAQAALRPLFDWALGAAKEGYQALHIHFGRVEYFNSSTIAALVQFIRAAQAAGLALVIQYDGSQKWQATTFEAMRLALRPLESPSAPPVRFEAA